MKRFGLLFVIALSLISATAKGRYSLRFHEKDYYLWYSFAEPQSGEQSPGCDIVVFFDENDKPYYYQSEYERKKSSLPFESGDLVFYRSVDGIDWYEVKLNSPTITKRIGLNKNRTQATVATHKDCSSFLGSGEQSLSTVNCYAD